MDINVFEFWKITHNLMWKLIFVNNFFLPFYIIFNYSYLIIVRKTYVRRPSLQALPVILRHRLRSHHCPLHLVLHPSRYRRLFRMVNVHPVRFAVLHYWVGALLFWQADRSMFALLVQRAGLSHIACLLDILVHLRVQARPSASDLSNWRRSWQVRPDLAAPDDL